MSSIGPQLPPHLAKRKRTPEDDDDGRTPGSPQSKVQRHTNDDEIALDSDSDDGFGPSAAPVKSQAASIGPSLPLAQSNNTSASKPTAATSSSPQTSRPQPQPQPAPAQAPESQPPKASIGPSLPSKRVLGPAPPPADLAERPPTSPDHEAEAEADSDSDSDSDDGYGPALPTASSRATAATGASIGPSAQPAAPAAPQRDSWMLAPPPDRGYRVADPTQIKARKFTSGPRAGGAGGGGGGGGGAGSSVWFETPEEKAKRLADAVLGRAADPTANNPHAPPPTAGAVRENGSSREQDERIRSFTEQTRGRSLYEEHQAAKAAGRGGKEEEEEEDDPSKRAFDREKDMALGSKITHSQRREMLNRAADFGGRFQKGKYL